MNDLGTVVTLLTGIPVIVGSVLGWLLRGSGPIEASNANQRRPLRHQRITLLGAFKSGVFNGIIRPDIPISNEVLKVFFGTAMLAVLILMYFWNKPDPSSELPIIPVLRMISFYFVCFYAIVLTVLWARLIWKMDYMNRMSDGDD